MEPIADIYSLNNKVGNVRDKGERFEVVVSNRALKERTVLYADDEDDLQLLVDAALRFYAYREIDYKYYPCSYLPWGKDTFYRFDVLGTRYRGEKAQEKAEELNPGDIVLLVRESDNPRDENAIRVTTMDGTTIGYVPARRCDDISELFDKVGIAIVEANNLYNDEAITVLFAFENCELEHLPWDKMDKPQPRLRVTGANPVRGKYFDVVGRFKAIGNKSNAIRYMEDLGGVAYWRSRIEAKPQIIVIGDGSTEKAFDEVVEREKADPYLKVLLESELVAIIEQLQPGFITEQAKTNDKPKKEIPKDISSARSYISKTLKKLETGTGDKDKLIQGLQQRVDMLLEAKEPMGDDLKLRLMYAGIDIE